MHAHPYARLTQLRRERLLRQHMNASRLADVEVLPDGQHATTVSCLADAVSWFGEQGIGGHTALGGLSPQQRLQLLFAECADRES